MRLHTHVVGLMLLTASGLSAQNAVSAGRLIVEPPTLMNLGFEWEISGDANRNAAVEVQYRETGAADMAPGAPAAEDRRRACVSRSRAS